MDNNESIEVAGAGMCAEDAREIAAGFLEWYLGYLKDNESKATESIYVIAGAHEVISAGDFAEITPDA